MKASRAAWISCSSLCDGAVAAAPDSGGPPIITGTKEAATGDWTPADVNTPTTDVLKCLCDRKLRSGGEG